LHAKDGIKSEKAMNPAPYAEVEDSRRKERATTWPLSARVINHQSFSIRHLDSYNETKLKLSYP